VIQDGKAAIAGNLFAGGGEMGALMRSLDWSQTALGAAENWSQSLKTAVRIVLTCRQPMFVWWGKDLINLYNDAYRAILGGKHPEALGQLASQVWHEIWDQVGPRSESAMLNNEGTYDEALLLIMERNGYPEETYYTFSYSPVPDDQGHTAGIICANTDDTQRIIGERQLALLRELAARTADARTFDQACTLSANCLETNLYDFPFAMIYLVDLDKQRAVLAGTSGIERGHRLTPEIIAFEDDSVWPFAEVIKSHQVCVVSNLEAQGNTLPTGAWPRSPHQAVVVPIAPSGKLGKSGILVAGLNPFRLFDDRYQGFLDLVAAQISASIANAQAYEEERKRAEALAELDQAKTAFFSNVSHEFRTPLTLMLSPLEELANTLDDRLHSDEREQLQMVQRNGLRLQKLVNTLLDFSRIEAGRVQASYASTDLATYTAELASVFRSLVEQAGMRLVIDCLALPEPVYIDREMWEKIVLNLISNAFKFTFSGSITVRLRSVGDSAEFSVIDTGVGIPEAELPRLFERFHRVSGTQARTYEGSGIGLALVQELVKLHGGTLQVTSQLGQGTTFTIALPFGSAHLPSDRVNSPSLLPSTATGAMPYVEEAARWLPESSEATLPTFNPNPLSVRPVTMTSARILLADDNTDMRDYVRRLLVHQGYQVETARDGMAALAAVRQQVPDLVLTDVMMPQLDGFGLLRELRSDAMTQEVPIILLSARAGEEARIEGLAAGADDYLIKPFSARELLARVEAALKLAQLRREAMQQEQALRLEAETAQQQVETILSSINDAFYVLDLDWRFTYVNDRLCEIISMKREQVLGHRIWDLFPDTVDTDMYVQFHQAFNEQIPIHAEYFYATWNRWYDHRIYPSPDGLTILGSDITDLKQAEQALRESEEQSRNILESIDDGFFALDQDWRFTYVNKAAETLLNRTPGDLIGKIFWDEYPGLMGSGFEQMHRRVMRDRIALSLTEFYPDHNRWYEVRNYPAATGITVYFRNVTDQIQAEESLRQTSIELERQLQKFNAVMSSVPDFIYMFDLSGRFIDANKPLLDLLQKSAAEVVGKNFFELDYPADLAAKLQNQIQAVIQTGRSLTDETLFTSALGTRAYEYIFVPIFDTAGQVEMVAGVTRDITEHKQLLEQEQAARTAAETANRIKDEFLAVVSHELRSPLNPILGWSKLLRGGQLDHQKAEQALEIIERNAQMQAQLINDLLDVSRILQGKLSLNASPSNLVSIIQSAIETVRLAAEAKSIQIYTQLDSEAGYVSGDPGRLQQIIWNLLSNAVKFTPVKGQVDIRLERCDSQAQITIQDNGKGIDPNFLPYVFDHFRQEDSATTRRFGGLGLGLAIVRYLMELHGGTVEANSLGEGQGSTFTVKLPLMPHPPLLTLDTKSPQPLLNLKGIKVLVVDDDDHTREFVAFLLKLHGASVTAVDSAGAALGVFAQFKPDVLLSDIGMPGMDGYMLMRQVRALPPEQGGQIPAIALTAYAGEIDSQQAMAAGFQMHIPKPVEPDILVECIASSVAQRKP
jgi:PAS domain S-box-containing protein